MIHRAKDLSPEQKVALESLLGRQVLEDESISVRAIQPAALSDSQKREMAERLKTYFAEIDSRCRPSSAAETEDAAAEAIRSTRPGYRPHR